eukprot:1346628-Amorphochlora_amoeboformis.AAC.1
MDHSVAGIVGGSAGALVAHPFDLLKVRMQTGDGVLGTAPVKTCGRAQLVLLNIRLKLDEYTL